MKKTKKEKTKQKQKQFDNYSPKRESKGMIPLSLNYTKRVA